MTAQSLEQAGQDQVFGERDVLLFPWVRAVVSPKDGRIVTVRQCGPMVHALVLVIEVQIVTLNGELPVLVTLIHRHPEDVLCAHYFGPLSGPAIHPPQRQW